MVRFALRYEMARGIEDVLARRSRLLFLDAARAAELAEPVAALIEDELGRRVSSRGAAGLRRSGAALPDLALSLRRWRDGGHVAAADLSGRCGLARIISRLC